MQQILINLLSNAIKCTPEHGTIEVRTDGDITQVPVHVRDMGIGMRGSRSVTSQLGEGSTFTLTLERAGEAARSG